MSKPLTAAWQDVWLLDGVRTPFVDYNGGLAAISPIDLGIKAAREVLARAGISPGEVGYVNPHATSTVQGDVAEHHALRRVFGDALDMFLADTTITHVRPGRLLPVEGGELR